MNLVYILLRSMVEVQHFLKTAYSRSGDALVLRNLTRPTYLLVAKSLLVRSHTIKGHQLTSEE